MREPSTRRDQREIVVQPDMRTGRSSKGAGHRPARAARPEAASDDIRASAIAFARWIARTCLTRPGEALGCVAALAAVATISVNALGFQAGRHPAPILPQALAKTEPAETRPSAEAPPREKPEPRHAEKAPARDAIGEIIRSADDTTASVTPKGNAKGDPKSEPKPDAKVVQAQRALAKLGYGALKPDGVMGPTTKAAIEKFERDRKMPVTGEAAGRTLRELAARAGPPKG